MKSLLIAFWPRHKETHPDVAVFEAPESMMTAFAPSFSKMPVAATTSFSTPVCNTAARELKNLISCVKEDLDADMTSLEGRTPANKVVKTRMRAIDVFKLSSARSSEFADDYSGHAWKTLRQGSITRAPCSGSRVMTGSQKTLCKYWIKKERRSKDVCRL
jgi:hypothetical protein